MLDHGRSSTRHISTLGILLGLMFLVIPTTAASAFTWHDAKKGAYAAAEKESTSTSLEIGIPAMLESKIGGTEVLFKATVFQNVGAGAEASVIKQNANAEDFGVFAFKHVKMFKKEAGAWVEFCTIKGEEIKTQKIKSAMVEIGGVFYDKLFPEVGTTLWNIVVVGCPLAETYAVKGTLFGESRKPGEKFVVQPLNFTGPINAIAGGTLTLGIEPATLIALTNTTLVGADAGEKFWFE